MDGNGRINIVNRYGENASYLEKIDENRYFWNITENCTYFRVSKDNGVVNFLDPEGGPFLSVGSEISINENIRKIKKIEEDENEKYIITFE